MTKLKKRNRKIEVSGAAYDAFKKRAKAERRTLIATVDVFVGV